MQIFTAQFLKGSADTQYKERWRILIHAHVLIISGFNGGKKHLKLVNQN